MLEYDASLNNINKNTAMMHLLTTENAPKESKNERQIEMCALYVDYVQLLISNYYLSNFIQSRNF